MFIKDHITPREYVELIRIERLEDSSVNKQVISDYKYLRNIMYDYIEMIFGNIFKFLDNQDEKELLDKLDIVVKWRYTIGMYRKYKEVFLVSNMEYLEKKYKDEYEAKKLQERKEMIEKDEMRKM